MCLGAHFFELFEGFRFDVGVVGEDGDEFVGQRVSDEGEVAVFTDKHVGNLPSTEGKVENGEDRFPAIVVDFGWLRNFLSDGGEGHDG